MSLINLSSTPKQFYWKAFCILTLNFLHLASTGGHAAWWIRDLPKISCSPQFLKWHWMQDLEIIFARFGKVTSCDIIRDYKTGDSLCYAFIGFDTDGAAESAYFKMENCLIDDRRIHVDFSQSMHHLWRQFRVNMPPFHDASESLPLQLSQAFKELLFSFERPSEVYSCYCLVVRSAQESMYFGWR